MRCCLTATGYVWVFSVGAGVTPHAPRTGKAVADGTAWRGVVKSGLVSVSLCGSRRMLSRQAAAHSVAARVCSTPAAHACACLDAAAPCVAQVLVDTEKDGHRVSFNDAFRRKGACVCDSELVARPCAASRVPTPTTPTQPTAWQSRSAQRPPTNTTYAALVTPPP
jgi:hypothetical protein